MEDVLIKCPKCGSLGKDHPVFEVTQHDDATRVFLCTGCQKTFPSSMSVGEPRDIIKESLQVYLRRAHHELSQYRELGTPSQIMMNQDKTERERDEARAALTALAEVGKDVKEIRSLLAIVEPKTRERIAGLEAALAAKNEALRRIVPALNLSLREMLSSETAYRLYSEASLIVDAALSTPVPQEPHEPGRDYDLDHDGYPIAPGAATRAPQERPCSRCGAAYLPTGQCSRHAEGCQGGWGESAGPGLDSPNFVNHAPQERQNGWTSDGRVAGDYLQAGRDPDLPRLTPSDIAQRVHDSQERREAERTDAMIAHRRFAEQFGEVMNGRDFAIKCQISSLESQLAEAKRVIEATRAGLKLALTRMAHRFECGRLRPAEEWLTHGCMDFSGCKCEIATVRAALDALAKEPKS